MAQKRITDMTTAGALSGAELVELSKTSSTITITAVTISAAAADNSFNDSANGFVAAGFEVGNRVKVAGFTGNVANNIVVGIVTALTAGKMTIGGTDGDVIVDDAAGESVTISKWVSRRTTAQEIADLGGGGGSAEYPDFTGNAHKHLAVNAAEDDVEWVTPPAAGGSSPSGSTFPVSPSDGERFYRSDRKIDYFYDAANSRWLSSQLFSTAFSNRGNSPWNATASILDFGHPWFGVYDVVFVKASFHANFVSNPGNFTIEFKLVGNGSPDVTFATQTLNQAANTNGGFNVDCNRVWLKTGSDYHRGLVRLVENSGTATLYGGAQLFYHLIG